MNGASVYARCQRDASNDVVLEHLPLVKKIGLHLIARLPPEVEVDDLLQVGVIGLIQARDGYDASQGASFSTYAGIRIKGAMLDEIRRNDWAPRSLLQKMKVVSTAIRAVENKIGRIAGDGDIAEQLGMTLNEYQQLSAELVSCSLATLEDPDTQGGDEQLNPFNRLEDSDFKEALAKAISSLPEKEKIMMSLYYNDELNLKEIGAILEVSESRVSQIHGQALARVRTRMTSWIG